VVKWWEFLPTDPEVGVRFPELQDFLRSSGSGTGSTRPRGYNCGATWKKEIREYDHGDPLRLPRNTLYAQKLAVTSPTSGGSSVGVVRSDSGHGVCFVLLIYSTLQYRRISLSVVRQNQFCCSNESCHDFLKWSLSRGWWVFVLARSACVNHEGNRYVACLVLPAAERSNSIRFCLDWYIRLYRICEKISIIFSIFSTF
jgi:hypothetical protein